MVRRKPQGVDERLQHSIDLLKKAEKLAMQYDPKNGFYLAFSGGKDSQALYHVAKLAGVKFQAHMNFTSIDPPEVIRFVREHYPDVITHAPKESIYTMASKGRFLLPSKNIRWCCTQLKEGGGTGTVCLTGVRRQESIRRAKRNPVEVSGYKFTGQIEQFEEWQKEQIEKRLKNLNQDQFTEQGESLVRCIDGTDKIIVNPIIDWRNADVWYMIRDVAQVPYCSLYEQGYHRIGCICCPQEGARQRVRDIVRYPHVKRNWLKAIKEIRTQHIGDNIIVTGDWGTGTEDEICERIFDWWISNKPYKEWFADRFLQGKLDFGDDDHTLDE